MPTVNFMAPDSLIAEIDSTITIQIMDIPDSVYIKRLSALPFEFKMTYNPIVKKFIELYTIRLKDKLQIIIGLGDFYFPIIDEILRSSNLPKELKYLPIIESALNPQAVSRAHAVGLWQFMRGTGKENGLLISNYVDQRRGLIESTIAASKYLKLLYHMYNDWQLTLAAYNCGPGNVNKAIRRAGGKRDFWEIYRYLPRETRGYVPAFIGAAYALNYYKEHNIGPIPTTLPLQTDTIFIYKNLHLGQVAGILGLPIDYLKSINPQYLKDVIPASGKIRYSLRVPSEYKPKFISWKDSIYAYRSSFYKNSNNCVHAIVSDGKGKVIHHVQSGESLWLIAGQYKVTVNSIKEWNNISGNKIRQGQKLIVYVAGHKVL